jgi:hypothetical protein
MSTRSGKNYNLENKNTSNTPFTNLHFLYYSSLYEKLINNLSRQYLAIYNLENITNDNEKFEMLINLEKIITNMKQ